MRLQNSPAVKDAGGDPDEAVRANVRATVRELGNCSEVLSGLASEGRLAIVGAVYSLDSGRVDFLEQDS